MPSFVPGDPERTRHNKSQRRRPLTAAILGLALFGASLAGPMAPANAADADSALTPAGQSQAAQKPQPIIPVDPTKAPAAPPAETIPAQAPPVPVGAPAPATQAKSLAQAPLAQAAQAEEETAEPAAPVVVRGAIGAAWNERLKGVVGNPVANEICANGVCYQQFNNGRIYWTAKTGAWEIRGGIGTAWTSRLSSRMGYPTSSIQCADGACSQYFQTGRIVWTAKTGAYGVRGAIRPSWEASARILGYPLADEVCGQVGGGCYQTFERGRIWWSPATAARPTSGAINAHYVQSGGPRSGLGYPTGAMICRGKDCAQRFRGGWLSWNGARGIRYHPNSDCNAINDGKMRYPTGNAARVLITTTPGYNQNYGRSVYCQQIVGLYVQDWSTDSYVGKSGFRPPGVPSGPTRYLFSPTGSYTVTEAFGLGNPGTRLPYRTLNPRSRWGGNPNTPTYNKYHESNSHVGWDEDMWYFATRPQHDYRQGVVLDYNRPTIVQDAGFAIFLHMNKVPTAGCIALDDWAVYDYVKKSVPGDRIIMGTRGALFG